MLQKSDQLLNSRCLVHCTIVGDTMVGKTCLSRSFSSLCETEDYTPTVFENYASKIHVNGDEYTISVFDTAGQVCKFMLYTIVITCNYCDDTCTVKPRY